MEPGEGPPVTVAEIDAAMRTIRPRRREIFFAVRVEGLSYAEVAARHRISIRRVERIIAAVLTQLRRAVARQRRRR